MPQVVVWENLFRWILEIQWLLFFQVTVLLCFWPNQNWPQLSKWCPVFADITAFSWGCDFWILLAQQWRNQLAFELRTSTNPYRCISRSIGTHQHSTTSAGQPFALYLSGWKLKTTTWNETHERHRNRFQIERIASNKKLMNSQGKQQATLTPQKTPASDD